MVKLSVEESQWTRPIFSRTAGPNEITREPIRAELPPNSYGQRCLILVFRFAFLMPFRPLALVFPDHALVISEAVF